MTSYPTTASGPSAVRTTLEDLLNEGRRLRERALELSSRIRATAEEFGLPPEAGGLALASDRLDRDEFHVVVVGEIKRGKSTLINALIGRPGLLPENVEVATSRLFRIQHAEQEGYRIRFEDGSACPLKQATDLTTYGSQVVEDRGEAPTLDKLDRWIEVDLPFELLPKSITFFDTPGVGGLKAAHRELTLGVLPEADAIVFVLDVEKPVEKGELDFLEAALKQTPHVFFVMTKVDCKERGWTEIRDKNLKHLRDRFGGELPVIEIWPFSSTRFQRACELKRAGPERQAEADRVLGESRYPEFYPALMTFLFRALGWSRAANVVSLAGLYLKQGDTTLADRWRSLREDSWREEYRNRQAEKRRWFGEQSAELNQIKTELYDGLREDISLGSYQMQVGMNRIEMALRDAIEGVSTLDQAQRVADQLGDAALHDAGELWRSIRSTMLDRLVQSLDAFFEVAEPDLSAAIESEPDLILTTPRIEGDLGRRLQTAGGYASSMGVVFGGVPTAALLVAGMLTPPLGALMAVVGGVATLFGFLTGWKSSRKVEAETLKAKLFNHLQRVMLIVRPHYTRAVDLLGRQLDKNLRDQIEQTAGRKRAEAEAELKRIDDEEKMTAAERAAEVRVIEAHAPRWKQLGEQVAGLRADLDRLHGRLVVSTRVGR